MIAPIIVAGARVAAQTTSRKGAQEATASSVRRSVQGVRVGVPRRATALAEEGVQNNRNNSTYARPRSDNPNITRASRLRQNMRDSEIEDEDSESSPQQLESVKYRIGAVASIALIMFAGFLDATELILDLGGTLLAGVGVVFGYIKDATAAFVFPLIFWILGAPFWKGKKAKKKTVTMISAFLVGLIPWIGAVLPETLVGVIATIYLTRKEDLEKTVQKNNQDTITRQKRNP